MVPVCFISPFDSLKSFILFFQNKHVKGWSCYARCLSAKKQRRENYWNHCQAVSLIMISASKKYSNLTPKSKSLQKPLYYTYKARYKCACFTLKVGLIFPLFILIFEGDMSQFMYRHITICDIEPSLIPGNFKHVIEPSLIQRDFKHFTLEG